MDSLLRNIILQVIAMTFISSPGITLAGRLVGGIEPVATATQIITQLKTGGYVIYFRHLTTEKIKGDVVLSDEIGNCSTQRNLSPEGRQLARKVGESFVVNNIPVGRVLVSPYCRTVDTAEEAFGRHQTSDALYFSLQASDADRVEITQGLLALLATVPEGMTNTVLVSHTGNLKEAVNIWPAKEGEAHIFKPVGDGLFTYVGKVLPEEWN